MARPDYFSDARIKAKGFTDGVKGLVGLDKDVRNRLRATLPSVPDQLQDASFVASSAKTVGIEVGQYESLASFSRLILSYIEADKLTVQDVIGIFQDSLGESLSDESKVNIESFLSMTKDEKEASRNVEAFYFGDSFNFAEFKALVVQGDKNNVADPQLGGNLTISYMNSSGSPDAISLNISQHELTALSEVISQSIQLLNRMKSKYKEG